MSDPVESETPEPATPSVPTLERLDGSVPPADTGRGRYVRLFGWVVVLALAAAICWGAVTLISVVHRG